VLEPTEEKRAEINERGREGAAVLFGALHGREEEN